MTVRTRRGGRSRSTDVASALARLDRATGSRAARSEWVRVADALGRVPVAAVLARRRLPARDQSMMDGYAVRCQPGEARANAATASRRLVGRSFPGDDGRRLPRVGTATAVEVLTGATMPPGSNAVVRLEACRRRADRIFPRAPVVPGRDIARAGEDFQRGQTVAGAGAPLRPWHLAALVANEVPRVRVVARPRVGVLSTGGEVIPAGHRAGPGRVRDTTKPLLRGLLEERGAQFVDLGHAPDRSKPIRGAVRAGLERCDVLLTIGGSSVGARDLVPSALAGMARIRWVAGRLKIRPGSATAVAVVRRRPIFVLSGPPVAAFAGFVSVVEPYLERRGWATGRASVSATLERGVAHSRPLRELVRVRLERRGGRLWARVGERRGSSRLSSLTESDGLLVLEEGCPDYPAGASVQVLRL
ncbi:MAG: molybdopterin molybdotransferase MoeA [Thermoplasmata archaeon]